MDSQFVDIGGARLEYIRIAAAQPGQPPLVLLHEGLGSVAMWRDFPDQLAAATGAEVVAYSRQGYGRSSPLAGPRAVDYMDGEARAVLPAFMHALGLADPVLIGHSDGASIALIYGGSGLPARGIVVMAPHVFVEDVTVTSIAAAKTAYETTDLRSRLARYHDSPDDAFWGWNDIWLRPAFRAWNIEALVPRIATPLLVIQGEDDEYGTRAHVDAIARLARVPCEVQMLADCRHSPYRDQPQTTLQLISAFTARLRP